jgi:hypothetical protein
LLQGERKAVNILIRNYQLIPGLGSLPPRAVAPAVLTAGCFFLFAMLPGMGEWLVVAAPLPPPSSSAVVKPQPSLSRQSTKSSKQTSKKSRNQSASSKKKSSQVQSKSKIAKAKARRSRSALASRRSRRLNVVRMRALHAREETLRSLAAANIEQDQDLGEDPLIRRAALEALGDRAGTVVVLDPNNGRVLTTVNQRMAVGYPVKPCSTIKMVVGLAALREQVFDPDQEVSLSRRHSMSLSEAMARSNNPLFQVLGRLLGFDRVLFYARNYGLGERTGVNYPGESPGYLPQENSGPAATGHMSSHGDNFGVTAMQLAALTAAIANGGSLYVPQVIRSAEELNKFQPILKRRIEMTPEDRERVLDGMAGAVTYGTGKLAYSPIRQVVGKTGTCTGDEQDKLGLFTSFTSVEQPTLVVTVITNGYQEAGRRAAEIAGKIYGAILPQFVEESEARVPPEVTEVTKLSQADQLPVVR